MNSKKRAFLKKKAHNLEPIVRIGKDGLNQNIVQSILDAIASSELLKVKILQNCEEEKTIIYSKLMDIISKMTENQMNTLFDFSGDKSKKEAHWNRDKNVRDVLIHLYEWHQLMLKFIENNADGKSNIPFLPPEYSWKTYGAMNVMFWNRHQNTSLERAKAMLAESHEKVLALADK